MRRKRSLGAPEAHVRAADRYWEGAQEIVLRIVLQSPSLFAPNVRGITYFPLSRVKYDHQLRQIRRREERKHESQ